MPRTLALLSCASLLACLERSPNAEFRLDAPAIEVTDFGNALVQTVNVSPPLIDAIAARIAVGVRCRILIDALG